LERLRGVLGKESVVQTGTEDFHVVPKLKFAKGRDGDDVEVVPTKRGSKKRSVSISPVVRPN
jgi:hypothetical protein